MSTTHELVGSQLGRYQIAQHLATGGMAEIFLAHLDGMAGFRKELVLKVLQTRWEDRPEIVDLFLGEARLSALMDHPNIVDVYDVARENDRCFIAMEHIAGKTLTELAKRAIAVTKSIPVEVGVFIAAEIAGALAYMYDGAGAAGEPLRVVHRDISPTNVLISNAGQVKLIDFGIARQGLTVAEESGVRPGKATYMSPEQVRGDAIDGRSDIFCLGTILYEITLGRRLWRGPRDVASKRILEERPKPPTFVRHDYPAELELIVLRTLEKKPEDRYQSATELYNDLNVFLERSAAHLRNNGQMADYLARIFSEEADALVSDVGRERARAFVEGGEAAEPDQEDLDFDVQQREGPGAALARALRTSALGVWADADKPKARPDAATSLAGDTVGRSSDDDPLFAESRCELDAAGSQGRRSGSSAGLAAAQNPVESSEKNQEKQRPGLASDAVADPSQSPGDTRSTRSSRTVVVGVVLFLAAMVGLFFCLRTG
jgi:serine/threonine-protein kinase